ncbi:MAG: hypothetical protein EHM79_16455 [Geobacter sp.]|nr:MAG: hypothetical protein EHM79_16455 [Geobacter sp.]
MKKSIFSKKILVLFCGLFLLVAGCEGTQKPPQPSKPDVKKQEELALKSIGQVIGSRTIYNNGGMISSVQSAVVRETHSVELGKATVNKENPDGVIKSMWPIFIDVNVDAYYIVNGEKDRPRYMDERLRYTMYVYENEQGEFDFVNGVCKLL